MIASSTDKASSEAVKLLSDWEKYKSSILERFRQLTEEQSYCDKAVVDIEHALELTVLDAVTMMKLSKKLRETLIRRRAIKTEINAIIPLCDYIGKIPRLELKSEKIYKFRTDVLSDFQLKVPK